MHYHGMCYNTVRILLCVCVCVCMCAQDVSLVHHRTKLHLVRSALPSCPHLSTTLFFGERTNCSVTICHLRHEERHRHTCVHSPKPSTLYPACARGCRADTHGQPHCCYYTRCCVGSINCMLSSQLPAITAVRAFPTLKCDAASACQFTRHWSAVSHHVPKKALQSPKVDL